MKTSLESLYEELKAKVPRMTRGKKIVVECLYGATQPLTAHDIYECTKSTGIDLATVYRNLEHLAKVDVVAKIEHSEAGWRYSLSEAHHTHSIKCVQCGKQVEMSECMLHDVERIIAERTGFSGIHHSVNFTGSCPTCQRQTVT